MDIVTTDGNILRHSPLQAQKFLNQTTIIYGPTKSGKSTLIVDILHTLKNYVSMCFVICPTESSNQTYKGIVPQTAIREHVDKNSIIEFLTKLWERQQMVTAVYKRANDAATLSRLYRKVNTYENDHKLQKINQFEKDALQKIEKYIDAAEHENNVARKAYFHREKDKIQDSSELARLSFYRSIILPHRSNLLKHEKLSEDEKYSLTYMKTNPNIILIIDDAMNSIKAIQKTPTFNNYIFMNRHVNCTMIVAAHDDTQIDADIRKNAFQSIYCKENVARAYFDRPSNGFSKEEKKQIPPIIDAIYSSSDYKRLLYSRGAPEPYSYIQARIHFDKFKVGSDWFWAYDEKVNAGKGQIDEDNQFSDLFSVQTNK